MKQLSSYYQVQMAATAKAQTVAYCTVKNHTCTIIRTVGELTTPSFTMPWIHGSSK